MIYFTYESYKLVRGKFHVKFFQGYTSLYSKADNIMFSWKILFDLEYKGSE